jgi:pimeloyl-ACP methyl ester carboxylesterase
VSSGPAAPSAVRGTYLQTSAGQVHAVTAGASSGTPVLLLHQTPRSADEYREVLVALGRYRRLVALDTLGYGASDPPQAVHSIEAYADGVLAAADALGADRFDLVGHHTGGVVAIEVAARAPERVGRLVLSSTALIDASERARRAASPHTLDAYRSGPDGRHLVGLWATRAPFYPLDRPDLLDRFVADALRAHDPSAGHRAVASYRMEERLPSIAADVLCVGHEQDPHAIGSLEPLARLLAADMARIPEGVVPLEYTAEAFVAIVAEFLTLPR